MNTAEKGRNGEYKAMRILEKQGYMCIRAAASHGLYDIWAIGLQDIKLVQVKVGTSTLTKKEREDIRSHQVPKNVSKEYWHFRHYARYPDIVVLT